MASKEEAQQRLMNELEPTLSRMEMGGAIRSLLRTVFSRAYSEGHEAGFTAGMNAVAATQEFVFEKLGLREAITPLVTEKEAIAQ